MGEQDRESPLAPGRRFGDFVLVRPIGVGGQGEVWEALDQGLKRSVALKILAPGRNASPDEMARLRREAEVVARLDHPNIVRIHQLLVDEGRLVLVEELLQGGSLDVKLRDAGVAGAARLEWVVGVVRDLARGLAHAHEHGIIHRDIKPANVLFTAGGRPKLADFGLALLADSPSITRHGALLGTPLYMSPEHARPGRVDERSDIWGLGATLYEMLTRHPPFPGEIGFTVLMDIQMREPRRLRSIEPAIPRDVEAVCLHCLEKAPGHRYRDAAELADDLDRVLARKPTAARPAGPLRRMTSLVHRMPASALALTAALIMAAWLLVDRVELRSLADRNLGVHATRLGTLLTAALLAAWPIALLLRRGLGGSRAAVLLAVPVVALLAWWPVDGILSDHQALRHRVARWEYEQLLHGDPERAFRETGIYSGTWEDILDGEDYRLLARVAIEDDRIQQAADWARRWIELDSGDPVAWDLQASLMWLLCLDDAWLAAQSRFEIAAAASCSWEQWRRIGELRVATGRLGAALQAFDRAANIEGVDRDLLNKSLTEARISLCRPVEAVESLAPYETYHQDAETRLLALRVALILVRQGQDHAYVRKAPAILDLLEADPNVRRYVVFDQRLAFATARGVDPVIVDFLATWRERSSGDPDLAAHVAQAHYTLAAAIGQTSHELSLALLEASRELFSELLQAAQDSGRRDLEALAQSNLAAVALQHRENEAAVALAQSGIQARPDSWPARYNFALAQLRTKRSVDGPEEHWPAGSWQEMARLWEAASECQGRQPRVLNNLAHSLIQSRIASGETLDLAPIRYAADRAVRVAEPDPATACEPDATQRGELSSALDTRSTYFWKLARDIPSALADARRAADLLREGERNYEERHSRVAELERLLTSPSATDR